MRAFLYVLIGIVASSGATSETLVVEACASDSVDSIAVVSDIVRASGHCEESCRRSFRGRYDETLSSAECCKGAALQKNQVGAFGIPLRRSNPAQAVKPTPMMQKEVEKIPITITETVVDEVTCGEKAASSAVLSESIRVLDEGHANCCCEDRLCDFRTLSIDQPGAFGRPANRKNRK